MARAIWSGAISFGLVNVPIKMYSAVSRKTVRFHQLHSQTGNRIAQKRVDPETDEEVPYENIVKGFELTKDNYVLIAPDELEALDPEATRTIDIEEFVDLDEIDPIYYDHPYYLVPDKAAGKAYGLLLEAMERSGKVAIARVVLRSKEYLVAVRPKDGVLLMSTMVFNDEVVTPQELDGLPSEKELAVTDKEVKMAQQLIESLSSHFDPSQFKDEYREKVLSLIERKAEGEEVAHSVPPLGRKTKVPDLMAALEASLKTAKESDKQSNGRATRSRGERGTSSGPKKPTRSRKPAHK